MLTSQTSNYLLFAPLQPVLDTCLENTRAPTLLCMQLAELLN